MPIERSADNGGAALLCHVDALGPPCLSTIYNCSLLFEPLYFIEFLSVWLSISLVSLGHLMGGF